jgi:hypothetical protein
MDSSVTVQVFDWRGEIWLTVDRVGRVDHRRHAHRDRLATFHAQPVRDVPEDCALLWMLEQLTAWVNAGCPRPSAQRARGPLGGASGGTRANGAPPTPTADPALQSQTVPTPLVASASEASSDGLWPEGRTDPLF